MPIYDLILIIAFFIGVYFLLSIVFSGIPIMLLAYDKFENGLGIGKNMLGGTLIVLVLIEFMSLYGINTHMIFNLLVFGATFYFIPKWLLKSNLYTKVLPATGIVIVLMSLYFYFFWVVIFAEVQTESSSFALDVLRDLGVNAWYEAFYRHYLPYLFRISAFFVYGFINILVGRILADKKSKRTFKILRALMIFFLIIVSAEGVHSLIFGRRFMV